MTSSRHFDQRVTEYMVGSCQLVMKYSSPTINKSDFSMHFNGSVLEEANSSPWHDHRSLTELTSRASSFETTTAFLLRFGAAVTRWS